MIQPIATIKQYINGYVSRRIAQASAIRGAE
jgi:hypothetical protein